MKRPSIRLVVAIAALMAMAVPALAAELHGPHHNAYKCSTDDYAVWHFVNNQTGGGDGWLVVDFAGQQAVTVAPGSDGYKANRNVVQWWVRGPAGINLDLVTAWSYSSAEAAAADLREDSQGSLPGKLVLSDWDCIKK